MRPLDSPGKPVVHRAAPPVLAGGEASPGGLRRRPLPPPAEAPIRLRRLLNPKRGWIRLLERWISHELSRRFYPRIPLIERFYERTLRRRLTVVEGDISIPGLPPPFDGVKILFASDVHTGPFVSPEGMLRTFSRIGALGADLLLFGGDFVTSRAVDFLASADVFRGLQAPLGVFGVLGNHDHYTEDGELLARGIQEAGIRLLVNRAVVLERGGAALALAGIDDLLMGTSDLEAALRGVPGGVPIILLSHNPDILFEAAERGVSLVLSGHTHAGQIRIPGLPVLVRMSRYRLDEGRFRHGGTELVVSAGLGAVGLPLRIACPPEVVLIRLRAKCSNP